MKDRNGKSTRIGDEVRHWPKDHDGPVILNVVSTSFKTMSGDDGGTLYNVVDSDSIEIIVPIH